MSINFPDHPTTNQIHTDAGIAWKWDGYKWVAYTGTLPTELTGVTAGVGLTGGGTGGNVTLSLEIPVTIPHGGTSATTAVAALANLGGFPIAGGTITGSVQINGFLNVNNNITAGGNISTGNTVTAGTVNTGYVYGSSDGGAGALRTWNTNDLLTFQYDNSSGDGELQWRINGGSPAKFICATENFRDIGLHVGGGPTTTVLSGTDIPGNRYVIYVDEIIPA